MRKNVLVAYATRLGSTTRVAETIGQALRESGASVEVRLVKDVQDLSAYQAVVVGSSIRIGHWLPEAVSFVGNHRDSLSRIPVAYFVVCTVMHEDNEANRQFALSYLTPVIDQISQVQPVGIGLFAGEADPRKMTLLIRWLSAFFAVPRGDFRDWEAIRRWTADISPALLGA
jgi:menaquinone-dependent protoporphyrinogen oxidase